MRQGTGHRTSEFTAAEFNAALVLSTEQEPDPEPMSEVGAPAQPESPTSGMAVDVVSGEPVASGSKDKSPVDQGPGPEDQSVTRTPPAGKGLPAMTCGPSSALPLGVDLKAILGTLSTACHPNDGDGPGGQICHV